MRLVLLFSFLTPHSYLLSSLFSLLSSLFSLLRYRDNVSRNMTRDRAFPNVGRSSYRKMVTAEAEVDASMDVIARTLTHVHRWG